MRNTNIGTITVISITIGAIVFIGTILLISFLLNTKNKKKNNKADTNPINIPYEEYISRTTNILYTDQDNTSPNNTNNLQIFPYTKKNLLTKTEYVFWNVLKEECDKSSLIICPKVRMEDFINVTVRTNKLKYRGYIKSRHIDFMICDSRLHILAGVELDDGSHLNPEAAQTDRFKDNVFRTIGLPLYRYMAPLGNYKESIERMIRELTYRQIPQER